MSKYLVFKDDQLVGESDSVTVVREVPTPIWVYSRETHRWFHKEENSAAFVVIGNELVSPTLRGLLLLLT